MKYFISILFVLLASCKSDFSVLNYNNKKLTLVKINPVKNLEVYCFLSYHCPLSLNQVDQIKQLKIKNENVIFKIFLPEKNFRINDEFLKSTILTIDSTIYIDSSLNFSNSLNVKIVPEYRVIHNNKTIYSGAFDNSYKGINSPSYNKNYINYIQNSIDQFNGKIRINPSKTKALGCKIE